MGEDLKCFGQFDANYDNYFYECLRYNVGFQDDGYVQCDSGQGLGVRDDDGCHKLHFVEAEDLDIANTFFKKNSHI